MLWLSYTLAKSVIRHEYIPIYRKTLLHKGLNNHLNLIAQLQRFAFLYYQNYVRDVHNVLPL